MKPSLAFAILFFLTSCTEVIDIPIPEQEKKIVIDARITNLPNKEVNYVNLFKTSYLNEQLNYFIPEANVNIIEENTATTYPYLQNFYINYLPEKPTVVNAGNTYTLTVTLGDSIYKATDKMPSLSTIDSMYVAYLEYGYSPLQNKEGYYLHVLFKDNPSEKNYYRYKVGGQNYFTPTINAIDVFDDTFLNPTQNIIVVPYAFSEGDLIYFELQSLSREAYEYYRGLSLLLNSDGGFFTTPPANPTTNISNGGLGFFMAIQISFKTLLVQ